MMKSDDIKKMLGEEAATFVENGMTVGLGTGSTANYLLHALAARMDNGLDFTGVPTSAQTQKLAEQLGIKVIELNDAVDINLAIDGADEVSNELNLIKGGGGAMLKEKMVAYSAKRFVVMADETKLVRLLGKFPLPVEVVKFGWRKVKQHIEALGCRQVTLRVRNGNIFVSDEGHYIIDCHFDSITDPSELNEKIDSIPGVVETGLFLNMAESVLVGYNNGTTRMIKK